MKEKIRKIKSKDRFDFKSFWRKLWSLLAPFRKEIISLLFMIVVLEMLRLSGPYFLKIIIDHITKFSSEDLSNIILIIIMMFAANQAVSMWNFLVDRKIFAILVRAIEYLSNEAHRKMVTLGLQYHEKENTGSKIIKINRGVDKIDTLFANFFWEVGPTAFQIILTTITLFVVNWRFGLVTVTFVPLFVILTLYVNKSVYPFRKMRFDQQEEAAGLMTQSIININSVKSFTQELREYQKFARATEKVKNSVLMEYGRIIRFNILRNFIIDSGRGMMLVLGVYLVWKGNITVGSLIFVYTISEKALLALYRFSRLYDRIMESGEAVERLYDLSREKPDIINPAGGIKPKNIFGKIKFKDVVFAYQESKIKALDKVSFEICPDCVTALVGPSGGGKTTIARMVYRHYDPTGGKVFLDDTELKLYDIPSFRKFMAIVPQEVEIFSTSVKENISYAKPRAGKEEIQAAARIANAEEFILKLKDDYDTLVGERGIKLSGGQRQRIGIARAILANPKILIFDEATSNLDSYSEKLIQEALDKIRKNRTVIIIAHRLSTIKKADKIIVLENGKVVEEGSHVELARISGGLYQKLISLQRMGDVE